MDYFQDKLISLYQEFIVDFEARLDPLSLVLIGQAVMERFTDPEEAIKFVEKIEEKTKMNKEAFVLTKVLVGKIKLHKFDQRKETKVGGSEQRRVLITILFVADHRGGREDSGRDRRSEPRPLPVLPAVL